MRIFSFAFGIIMLGAVCGPIVIIDIEVKRDQMKPWIMGDIYQIQPEYGDEQTDAGRDG